MKIAFSTMLACLILLLLALVPAAAQEGTDETEPNNTRSHANEIDGLTLTGEVGQHDAADWFVLNGQEGTNPTMKLTYNANQVDIDMDVYSDNELVGSLTGTDGEDSDTFDIPGTCYLKIYAYSGHGEYTVDITPGEQNNSNNNHQNTHNNHNNRNQDCAGVDEDEPNDTQDDANEIDGLSFEGYACKTTDSSGTQIGEDDWFVLNGQEGTNPTITLTYDNTKCDIDMDVYSDDEVVGDLSGTDSPDTDTFDIPGTCYLHVYAYDGEGDYTIDITPAEEHPQPHHRSGGRSSG